MSISSANAPAAAGKTRYVETLTSGTSWTVPAGVTYVNATLVGGGQGGAGGYGASNQGWNERGVHGLGGQIITCLYLLLLVYLLPSPSQQKELQKQRKLNE